MESVERFVVEQLVLALRGERTLTVAAPGSLIAQPLGIFFPKEAS